MDNALRKDEMHTVSEIEKMPENVRAELIDGDIYMMSTPSANHQMIQMEISAAIRNYIRSKEGNCRIYPAPFAVYLYNDDYNYFEPDITIICDPSKIDNKGCHGAPDWVIEIVSPSSRRFDYMVKLFKYEKAGVREYWIVDPDAGRVTVYDFENEDTFTYTFDDKIKVSIYGGELEVDFGDIKKQLIEQ
ncbi:MAG: Uma2 family endonuclease [Lachnospiraceae bacterium]|nr:Uma2 family endonuclease [Lachnospiraceae bacterium]